jgi:hypothetical protein
MAVIIPASDLNNATNKYLEHTNQLNDYNEINNLNDHLLSSNNLEIERLKSINNNIRSKLMKAKQSYLLTDYSIHELSIYNNLLLFTILLTCVIILVVSTSKSKAAVMWISGAICILYLIVIIVVLSSNVKRRKYAWNQWYWESVEKKKSEYI